MRIYETMFIIDPNLEDAARDELANRVKSWIEEKVKGEIRTFDRWGMRQLAYRVDKFFQGDYTVAVFNADPQNVKALEDMYRITPQIFRWMVFRREDLEKHHNAEAEKVEESAEVSEMETAEEVNSEAVVAEEPKEAEKVEEVVETQEEPQEEPKKDEGENS